MKKSRSFQTLNKESRFLLFYILKHFFGKNILTIECKTENEMEIITLVNTFATRYGFFNEKFLEIICQILEIKA